MAVNLRKFMQLIVFFSHHESVKPLGKTKLFKLLYFTDATHLEKAGQSITGAEYLKYPYGPVPIQGDYAIKELRKRQFIRIQRMKLSKERPMQEIIALQAPNMAVFTTQEMITISHVIEQYGDNTASVLSWKSHHEDAWLFAEDWRPLQLSPGKPITENESKNAAAIALLDEWYATPDDRPPGYWDELIKDIETNRLRFRDEDIEL
jgi:uncharacterized phage-associated protein